MEILSRFQTTEEIIFAGYKKGHTKSLGETQEAMAVGNINGSFMVFEKDGFADHHSSNVSMEKAGELQQVKVQYVRKSGKILSFGTKKNKKVSLGDTYELKINNPNYGINDRNLR